METMDGSEKAGMSMSKECVITKLQQIIYGLNLAAVCFVSGIMMYSMFKIVDTMYAGQFLRMIGRRPWQPELMMAVAVICYFSLVFFNCEIDKDFFIVGPGELLNLELFVEPGKPMDINKLAGEYVVQSMPNIVEGTEMQQPGHFGSGMMYEYYGRFIPIGSYYTTYVENGAEGKIKGLATGGTVKVTIDGDMLTFDVDLEVEGGHHVTMNYTHDASMIADYSGYGAPRKVVENKSCFIPIRSKVNVMHPAGAIRCIKK